MVQASQIVDVNGLDQRLAGLLQQQLDLGSRALEQNNPDMAITFFQNALSRITPDLPFYDHITHNLLLGYKNRIEQLIATDRKTEAVDLLDDALNLRLIGEGAADPAFRRIFADVIQNIGLEFFKNQEFEACIRCCRKAISIEPCPTYHVNLTNSLAILKKTPLLSDFTTRITPQEIGRHIFIACVPKSASTFLKNTLVELTGYRDLFSVYSSWQTDQELYLPSVVEYAHQNTVTQQHCRASEANIQIMQAFGIRPVVLVRNIFDAVVSLRDFYRNGAYFNSYFREDFPSLDEEKQVDLLIDYIVPWYLQFVASWDLAERENRLEIYWLSYEELIRDKTGSIARILEFYGLGVSGTDLERVVKRPPSKTRRNRFNVGVTGRGKVLTSVQKERIIALTQYYQTTDFSHIGL